MPEWKTVGAHRYYCEPDLLVLVVNGEASPSELAEILAAQDALFAVCSDALNLVDLRRAAMPGPEVRRMLSEHGKRLGMNIRHSVVITNNAILRTMLLLVERATRLLTGQPSAVTFVGSDDAAWAWVAARRRQRERAKKSSAG